MNDESKKLDRKKEEPVQEKKKGVHADDITFKYMFKLFTQDSLECFKINSKAKVVNRLDAELITSDLNLNKTDLILEMDDQSLLHIEFQKTSSKDILRRIRQYNILLDQYYPDRPIKTCIIYSANIKPGKGKEILKQPCITFSPMITYMFLVDGDAIYRDLCAKIDGDQQLSGKDLIDLVFLMTYRSKKTSEELAEESVRMADTINDKEKKAIVKAGIVNLAAKYTDLAFFKKMERIIDMIPFEEKIMEIKENAIQKGRLEGLQEGLQKGLVETAVRLIKLGQPLELIKAAVELDDATLQHLIEEEK